MRRSGAASLFLALNLVLAPTAQAQLAGRVSVESQHRSRGYAIAEADPVASGTLSYDDSSGAYANATVLIGTHDKDVGLAGFQAGVGYAARATRTISIDAGIVQTEYARIAGETLDLRYTEAYAGLTVHNVTARAYYSPNYFARGHHTLYTELESSISPLANWSLNLHLGALTYLSDPPRYAERTRYDWRATVSRNLGAFEIYGSLSGRSSGRTVYSRSQEHAVLAAGAAIAF